MEDTNMGNTYTVGGYAEGWCTKCRLQLGHTIIAMVDNAPAKVKCNTCNSQHNFHAKESGKSRTSPKTSSKSASSSRKIKTQEANYNDYASRLAGYDLSTAQKYSLGGNFKKDEIIDHLKFGVGIVLSVIQSNKIEILFKDGLKILVQNSAGGVVFANQ